MQLPRLKRSGDTRPSTTMVAALTCLVAAWFASATAAFGANGDHLYPPETFRDDTQIREPAERALLGHDERQVVMVAMPAFAPEWAVYVAELAHSDGTIRRRVFARAAVEGVWLTNNKNKNVKSAEAPIDDETFALLHELWTAALAQASSDGFHIPFDGVWFLFEDRDRRAYACTPSPGTNASALAEVGNALFDYAFATQRDRPPLLAALRSKARATRLRFGLPEESVGPKARAVRP